MSGSVTCMYYCNAWHDKTTRMLSELLLICGESGYFAGNIYSPNVANQDFLDNELLIFCAYILLPKESADHSLTAPTNHPPRTHNHIRGVSRVRWRLRKRRAAPRWFLCAVASWQWRRTGDRSSSTTCPSAPKWTHPPCRYEILSATTLSADETGNEAGVKYAALGVPVPRSPALSLQDKGRRCQCKDMIPISFPRQTSFCGNPMVDGPT